MATILNATRLTKIYDKKKAVDNIDINVNAGSLVAFLGPNGAGKSTTIKMLTTILRPSGGEFWLMVKRVRRQLEK
ncbi:ATP-binding cassette domain-containing protein, partial [Oenococcus oeni]|uniref:ATP-binding cassette domain-containing protein n=1 Tax=Oenococcus oeni TaxID=1247 RepID=UPI000B0D47F2